MTTATVTHSAGPSLLRLCLSCIANVCDHPVGWCTCEDHCRRSLDHGGTCRRRGPQRCARCGVRDAWLRDVEVDDVRDGDHMIPSRDTAGAPLEKISDA